MTIKNLGLNNGQMGNNDVLQLFPEVGAPVTPQPLVGYDDTFSLDDIVSVELLDSVGNPGEMPIINDAQQEANQVANVSWEAADNYQLICNAIDEENNSIGLYTNLINMLSDPSVPPEKQHLEMVPVLKDIVAEEHRHLGQLQALQKILDANSKFVQQGEQEAMQQLGMDAIHPAVNQSPVQQPQKAFAPLQVTSIDPINKNADSNMKTDNGVDMCSGDDLCSVADVDDSF